MNESKYFSITKVGYSITKDVALYTKYWAAFILGNLQPACVEPYFVPNELLTPNSIGISK